MRLIGLAGWSGAGKTTLLVRLLPQLASRGLRISTIKHAHHDFDIDKPGKDSWLHRQAGAAEVLVASAARFALMREHRGEPEPDLPALLARLADVDLVIVEGFRRAPHPKIEVHRAANDKPFLWPDDSAIVAIATDAVSPGAPHRMALDDIAGIADCVLREAVAVDRIAAAE